MVGTGRGAQLGILIKGPEVLEQTRRDLDDRARQDRHDHRGPDAAGRRARRSATSARRAAAPRRRGRVGERAPDRAGDRASPAPRRRRCRRCRELPQPRRARRRGASSTATRGARRAAVVPPRWAVESRRARLAPGRSRREAQRRDGRRRRLGRRAARAVSPSPTRSSRHRRRQSLSLKALGLAPVLAHRRQRARRPRGRRRGRDRARCAPRCCPPRRLPRSSALQRGRRDVSRWSATASTTRRRSPRPTSASRSAPAPTSRSRPSDLTLVSGDLRAAVDAIRLARRTLATIKGNLFWAFAYNVAAIPLAVAGLLNPIIAAAAMAGLEHLRRHEQPAAAPLPQRPGRSR